MGYSFAQLEGLWEQAGGSHALAPVMAAIALAESGGNPNATGALGEKGLWQIYPKVWGSLATYDPAGNARGAVHIESVQGLSAWSTYNNGAYKHHLGSAKPQAPGQRTAPVGNTPGTGGDSGVPNPAARSTPAKPQAPGQRTAPVGNTPGTGGDSGVPNQAQINASVQKAVGAITQVGQTTSGESWQHRLEHAIAALDPLASIPAAIVALSLPFDKFAQGLDWFFVPSHWIRIFAGRAGGGMVLSGVGVLALGGDEKPISLPLGILLLGGGGVLLFIAFHNLDPSIKTVGEVISDVQAKALLGAGATTSPAGAVSAAGG